MEKISKKKRKLLNLKKIEMKIGENNYYIFYYNNFQLDHIKIQRYIFKNTAFNSYNLIGIKSPFSIKFFIHENSFLKNLAEKEFSKILAVQQNLIYIKKFDFNVKQKLLILFFCFLNINTMTNVYYFNTCKKEKI
jgi:hypothetical protein